MITRHLYDNQLSGLIPNELCTNKPYFYNLLTFSFNLLGICEITHLNLRFHQIAKTSHISSILLTNGRYDDYLNTKTTTDSTANCIGNSFEVIGLLVILSFFGMFFLHRKLKNRQKKSVEWIKC